MTSKIALITGGNRGLGKDTALKMAERGYDLVITYHSQEQQAHEVVKDIEALGRKAAALRLDVGNIAGYDSFFGMLTEKLRQHWGQSTFDYLVNNAGFGGNIPFLQATEADFDSFMNVHYKGVFFFTQKAVTHMNDGGSILNFSSGTTRFCNPGYAIYASMKGAVEVLTRYMAKELGSRGITVNILAPGPIETDFNNAAIRNNPELKARLSGLTALGRVGVADDIGKIAAFLCSDEARWINGQRIEASGGINL